jgi:hypothetical protein
MRRDDAVRTGYVPVFFSFASPPQILTNFSLCMCFSRQGVMGHNFKWVEAVVGEPEQEI